MALEAGDAREGTGLAGLMAEKVKDEFKAKKKEFDIKKGHELIDGLAKAIVEYLVDNTEVEVTDVEPGAGTAPGTIS